MTTQYTIRFSGADIVVTDVNAPALEIQDEILNGLFQHFPAMPYRQAEATAEALALEVLAR